MSDRYARQRAVPGVGQEGQRRIAAARVTVEGDGEDARVAARYLAGAGIGALEVAPAWAEELRAYNSEIEVIASAGPGALSVSVAGRAFAPSDPDALGRGARAARWALGRVLSA